MGNLLYTYGQLLGPFSLVATAFWMWMIYDCVRNDPERNTWMWLLIFLNGAGALIYFFARYLPRTPLPLPKFAGRWMRRDELWQAEAAARNIGNAYQFVTLAGLLQEIGEDGPAAENYEKALAREPDNLQALWGAAGLALKAGDRDRARGLLERLMERDPNHGYGDASLAYGKLLFEAGELERAETHFSSHLKSWGHPEAYLLQARIQEGQGNLRQARESLETMIARVKGAPAYHYRKHRHFVAQAEKALRALPL
jgi:hypothetical protein